MHPFLNQICVFGTLFDIVTHIYVNSEYVPLIKHSLFMSTFVSEYKLYTPRNNFWDLLTKERFLNLQLASSDRAISDQMHMQQMDRIVLVVNICEVVTRVWENVRFNSEIRLGIDHNPLSHTVFLRADVRAGGVIYFTLLSWNTTLPPGLTDKEPHTQVLF